MSETAPDSSVSPMFFADPIPDSFSLYIFDLDGTLIDSLDDLTAAVNGILVRKGFERVGRETVRLCIGHGARNLVAKAFEFSAGHAMEPAFIDSVLPEYREIYRGNGVVHTFVYPGMTEWLDDLLRRGKKIAVLTNKPEKESREILAALGIADRFFMIAGPETYGAVKPDPAGIFGLMNAAGTELPSCALTPGAVMIGDSDVDLLTGRNAGIPVCAVTGGIGDEAELRALAPDWIIERNFA